MRTRGLKPVSERESVNRAFDHRPQAVVLRDEARRLELEGRLAMHRTAEK